MAGSSGTSGSLRKINWTQIDWNPPVGVEVILGDERPFEKVTYNNVDIVESLVISGLTSVSGITHVLVTDETGLVRKQEIT